MKSELDQLRAQIRQMERSAAKLALIEEAVRLADLTNDVAAGFNLRDQLTEEAVFGGRPEVALVAFGWNLAQFDKNPEQYSSYRVLWQYKWAALALREFPQISRQQINDTLTDLARRFKENGAGERSFHQLKCQIYRTLGDTEQVKESIPLWKKAPRDYLSDCSACDRNALVEAHSFLGEDAQAIKVAQTILTGRMRCAEVPHLTYAVLLSPLLRLGRADEAANYHRLGYRLIKASLDFIEQFSEHLIYLVLVQDSAAAIKLFERHLGLALAAPSPLRRYCYYRASLLLFRRLQKGSRAKRKLRLPNTFPLWNEQGTYELAQVGSWFETEALALAKQFDARSGNNYRMTELEQLNELEAYTPPITNEPSDPAEDGGES